MKQLCRMTPAGRRAAGSDAIRLTCLLVALSLAGCSNPWTDGRFWHQPREKPRTPSNTLSVGRYGGTMQSSVGNEQTGVAGDWQEGGAAATGRAGRSMESVVGIGRTADVGDVYDAPRYGRSVEAIARPMTSERTMTTGSWREGSMESRVSP